MSEGGSEGGREGRKYMSVCEAAAVAWVQEQCAK
jgi:hypothetical protein